MVRREWIGDSRNMLRATRRRCHLTRRTLFATSNQKRNQKRPYAKRRRRPDPPFPHANTSLLKTFPRQPRTRVAHGLRLPASLNGSRAIALSFERHAKGTSRRGACFAMDSFARPQRRHPCASSAEGSKTISEIAPIQGRSPFSSFGRHVIENRKGHDPPHMRPLLS